MTSAPYVLQATGIGVSYGRVRALDEVSVQVRTGGLVLVLGLNGAGKTSLMRAIAGTTRLRSGRVLLGGADVSRTPAHRRVRHGIAMVPEGRGVLARLSVHDNLELGWHSAPRKRRRPRNEALDAIFDLFPVLGQRLRQDCSTLSGGEMQMLAISRALLAQPAVILLDEPSLGLAPKVTDAVYEAVSRLAEQGVASVVVEQKAVPMRTVPDTVLVLRNGAVVHTLHDRRPSQRELAELYLSPGGGNAREHAAVTEAR